jgi:hypothetical protein
MLQQWGVMGARALTFKLGRRPMPTTVLFSRYDLQNAEERIAELQGYIERKKSTLRSLEPGSDEATELRRTMTSLSRTLGHFHDHRRRIEDDLKDH